MKIRRDEKRKPLMEKLETGGLGGSFKPAARPAYDKYAKTYADVNRGLAKAAGWGKDFLEGLLDEVFDVKVGSHKRKKAVRKATRW